MVLQKVMTSYIDTGLSTLHLWWLFSLLSPTLPRPLRFALQRNSNNLVGLSFGDSSEPELSDPTLSHLNPIHITFSLQPVEDYSLIFLTESWNKLKPNKHILSKSLLYFLPLRRPDLNFPCISLPRACYMSRSTHSPWFHYPSTVKLMKLGGLEMVQIGIFLLLPGIEPWSWSLRNVGSKRHLPFPNICPLWAPGFFICLFLIFYTYSCHLLSIFSTCWSASQTIATPTHGNGRSIFEGVVNYCDRT
jgi:hypothetical protein